LILARFRNEEARRSMRGQARRLREKRALESLRDRMKFGEFHLEPHHEGRKRREARVRPRMNLALSCFLRLANLQTSNREDKTEKKGLGEGSRGGSIRRKQQLPLNKSYLRTWKDHQKARRGRTQKGPSSRTGKDTKFEGFETKKGSELAWGLGREIEPLNPGPPDQAPSFLERGKKKGSQWEPGE